LPKKQRASPEEAKNSTYGRFLDIGIICFHAPPLPGTHHILFCIKLLKYQQGVKPIYAHEVGKRLQQSSFPAFNLFLIIHTIKRQVTRWFPAGMAVQLLPYWE
jgi:hypothetical protein